MSKDKQNGVERSVSEYKSADKETYGHSNQVDRRSLMKAAGVAGIAGFLSTQSAVATSSNEDEFDVIETTATEVYARITNGDLTSEEIVTKYFDRIDAYDDELSSVITLNNNAVDRAKELDDELEKSGPIGPLHGVPILIKDIINTSDLPTTAGNVLFEDTIPPEDAFVTSAVREAGAVVLAKVNTGEFASGSLSSLGGQTRNPYDTDRNPSGSSTGTGAAVAANFGTIGIGTETSGSILGPATSNSLVGVQPTTGLVSRDGIVPLSSTLDTAGPMTRTVSDAARLFDVMVGYDPNDPVTAEGVEQTPDESYTSFLNVDGLENARLGIPRDFIVDEPEETGIEVGQPLQVVEIFEKAVEEMESAGATIVDPVEFPSELVELASGLGGDIITYEFKRELTNYIESLGDEAPVDSMEEILDSETIEGSIIGLFEAAVEVDMDTLDENVDYLRALQDQQKLKQGLYDVMADYEIDALIYPTNNRTPGVIGEGRDIPDSISPNARTFSPIPNFPSITVPAGYTSDPKLPVGISFNARPFEEPLLFELSYSYEQKTMLRQPPEGFEAL